MKRVLDVGNCGPDHGALVDLLTQHFDVEVVQAHGHSDALEQARKNEFHLVTINRVMDRDGSSGLDIIQALVQDPQVANVPVLLISNYPQYQEQAAQIGAAGGFGKASLGDPATVELFSQYLR